MNIIMKRGVYMCVFILLCGCSEDSPEPNKQMLPAPEPFIEYHKVLYPDVAEPVAYSDVTSLTFEVPTQRYSYGDDSLQFAEYWSPSTASGRANLPVIVFVHGGCWSNSFRIEQSYPIATALALNGFPVWSIEYRATGDAGGAWPGTYHDVEAALISVDNKRQELFVNRNLIVVGHSAGGHLSLLASSNMSQKFDVVGLAAIVNITDYVNSGSVCSGSGSSFMNGPPSAIPEQYALANPTLDTLTGSAYLFIGGRDNIVPSNQAVNSGLNYRTYAPAGHFDWIHPGTNSFSVLLSYLSDQ